jgi:Ca2+-binding EF-hand superfamily protein
VKNFITQICNIIILLRFYEHAINERVKREKFPELLGLLGTDIAENFAFRIFDTFASDKKTIQLNEYLKYVDVYHHGDENERCRVTFKLMDKSSDGTITCDEFENYLNLIISAIKKVHPGAMDNLLSQREMKKLFQNISNNKESFNYADFELVYHKKPELLSWIDYFKNNDEEVLYLINNNLKTLIKILETFFHNFHHAMQNTLNTRSEMFNLTQATEEITKFCILIERKRKNFINSEKGFNIRTILQNLTKSFVGETYKMKSHKNSNNHNNEQQQQHHQTGKSHNINNNDTNKGATSRKKGGVDYHKMHTVSNNVTHKQGDSGILNDKTENQCELSKCI